MSRRVFAAELKPEQRLSGWLFAAVALAVAAGVWTISKLPVSAELRWLGATGWALAAGIRGGLVVASQLRCRQLNIHADGSALLQGPAGDWRTASVGKNSVVLANLAWIDLSIRGGRRFSGLFCGNSRESEQWRRFQVIWRHMGSGS